MIAVANTVICQFDAMLKKQEIPISQYGDYKKWLRYFLDFITKYPEPTGVVQRVQPFLEKLQEKKQSEEQRKQAEHAVKLYVDMRDRTENECVPDVHLLESRDDVSLCSSQAVSTAQQPQSIRARSGSSHYCDAGYQEKSDSPEWDAVLATMADEIKVRHYSRKTLVTYAKWSRYFQKFRSPDLRDSAMTPIRSSCEGLSPDKLFRWH